MIYQQCVNCTRLLPRIVTTYNAGVSWQLSNINRSVGRICNTNQTLRTYHTTNTRPLYHITPLYHYTTPLVSLRLYTTENNKPPSGELPLPLVKPKAVDISKPKAVDISKPINVDRIHTDLSNKSDKSSENLKLKTDPTSVTKVQSDENIPKQLSLSQRSWIVVKEAAMHYYDGSRLFVIELAISLRLLKCILYGKQLTRRERNQLARTVRDLFRLVPLAFFLLIPFMELLLPLAVKLFPNLLPSTFESIDKKKERKIKKLKLKLDMAKFIQESMVSSLPVQTGEPKELKRFSEFIASTRSNNPLDDIDELVSFSGLFSDHLTLDNIPRQYLVALCQIFNIKPFGTDNLLRMQLRYKMKSLRDDDLLITAEGLDTLTPHELQQANADRGMRAVGVSKERLKLQLEQWLKLRLENKIPVTLLLLSRVMTLPTGPTPSYEDLRNAVAHLPDSLIGEAKISLAARAGEKLDNRSRLDAVRIQEELIASEKEQQAKKDKISEEKDRLKEELDSKEEANTRVAANIQMKKETLKDWAKPILTEDEIEIRRQEVTEIQKLIAGLRDKKNPLLEEKGELRDLIETALNYQISLEADKITPSRGDQMLSNRVAAMLNKSHKVLVQLEQSLQDNVEQIVEEEEDIVLTKAEIQLAIAEILNMDKKNKLLKILEIVSDTEGKIKTSEVLKALEKLAIEGTDLDANQITAVMKVAHTPKTPPAVDKKKNLDQ